MTGRDDSQTADRGRWIALVLLCTGFLMIILDQTIVNVALPSIQDDLGFSQSNLAWVINAYLIAFGGLLLLAGRLGDLIGRKRVFMVGLTLFTIASLLCGLAQSEGMLIGARFLQGVGGALTSSVILGMIVALFPQPLEQARAMAVYSFVAAAGASSGLFLGGLLTEAINWHWIFFVNLPIGVLTAIAAMRVIDRDEGIGLGQGADAPGALLIVSALMLGVYAIVQTEEHGWGSARTLIIGALAVALLASFLTRQAAARQPLMQLRIFRTRTVLAANIVVVLLVGGMFGALFLGPLFLQRVVGYSSIGVGAAFVPMSVVTGTVSLFLAAKLTMRFGARQTLLAGLVLIAGSLLLFSRAPSDADYLIDVLPAMLMWGIGAGLAYPAVIQLAMTGAAAEDAGLASGIVNTTQQVGGALTLSVLVTLSTTRTDNLRADGASMTHALTSGYHLAFTIAGALVAAGIAMAAILLRRHDGTMTEQQTELAAKLGAVEAAYAEQ